MINKLKLMLTLMLVFSLNLAYCQPEDECTKLVFIDSYIAIKKEHIEKQKDILKEKQYLEKKYKEVQNFYNLQELTNISSVQISIVKFVELQRIQKEIEKNKNKIKEYEEESEILYEMIEYDNIDLNNDIDTTLDCYSWFANEWKEDEKVIELLRKENLDFKEENKIYLHSINKCMKFICFFLLGCSLHLIAWEITDYNL